MREKMTKIRELHKSCGATKLSKVCKKCYLPRKTQDDKCTIDVREFSVHNYTKRSQIIGT